MKKYECVKEMHVECYDEKGHYEEKETTVEVGSIWIIEDEKSDFRMIGGEIRLTREGENEYSWLEIYKDNLEEHFKPYFETEEDKLNREINRLYSKIEDGTMEQNSIELFTYMWLAELRDRRLEDKK